MAKCYEGEKYGDLSADEVKTALSILIDECDALFYAPLGNPKADGCVPEAKILEIEALSKELAWRYRNTGL